MTHSYHDAIRDLLADGIKRTVEEIRKGIHADETAGIHRTLRDMLGSQAIHRPLYPLRYETVRGRLYYWREGIEEKVVDGGTFDVKARIRFKEKEYQMKIEADIPIPEPGKRSPWPWDKLEIGESFVIEGRTIFQVGSLACKAKDRTGFKFTCRTEGENVRVWRVA